MNKKKVYIQFPSYLLKEVIDNRREGLISITKQVSSGLKAQKGESTCNVNLDLFQEFVNKPKKDKDWYEFICYMAIKSILGKSKFTFTNYKHILSRMLGFNSYYETRNATISKNQIAMITKYSKDHNMKRLIEKLELNWNILAYSKHARGIFISTTQKSNYTELAKECENRRLKNKTKALNDKKKEAFLNVVSSIKQNENFDEEKRIA